MGAQQFDWSLLTTLLVFGVLLFVRSNVAQCGMGTFDLTCICINDASCTSSDRVFGALCPCINGNELSPEDPEKDLQEINQKGRTINSLYISGINIESLEPFQGALGSCHVVLAIENTSIASMSPMSRIQCLGGFQILFNHKLTDLNGLQNLKNVNGDLIMIGNDALANFLGFPISPL